MKLHILSDLHIDSYTRRGYPLKQIPATDADVIMIAGDTSNGDGGMKWLSEEAKRLNKPMITIAGNHEYFGQDVFSFDDTLAQYDNFSEQTQTGLRVLQCQSIDLNLAGEDIRILGCTMWTDYQYNADENTMDESKKFMRDYREIEASGTMFSPEASIKLHAQHRAWLQQALLDAHQQNKKVVVMTHHSASPLSIAPKYADFPSNAAFITDFSEWMQQPWSPVLWVHGHTHEAFDYQIGNTRVVVNPRAYPGEVSSTEVDFAWDKVVEV